MKVDRQKQNKVTQARYDDAVLCFIIKTRQSMTIIENEHFRDFVDEIATGHGGGFSTRYKSSSITQREKCKVYYPASNMCAQQQIAGKHIIKPTLAYQSIIFVPTLSNVNRFQFGVCK